MGKSNEPFADEGFRLMGAAFEVHNVLGGGLAEEIYQESLEIELGLRSYSVSSQAGTQGLLQRTTSCGTGTFRT